MSKRSPNVSNPKAIVSYLKKPNYSFQYTNGLRSSYDSKPENSFHVSTSYTNKYTSMDVEEEIIKDWKNYLEREKAFSKIRLEKVENYPVYKASDFIFIKTIGKGAFGRVMLTQKKDNKKMYACKIMKKKFIVENNHLKVARNEKLVLQTIRCPFTTHLEFFFQDTTYLYYGLPVIEGGELYTYLRREEKFSEHISRFFAAQVLLALEYLHYLDLIYRDLKPENVLIDRAGYIRVSDFGFCKKVFDRTYTMCGTPEYIAPEILISKGYGKSADWWSFGVFIYEINSGFTPFYAKEEIQIYEKTVKGKYKIPPYFSKELADIIQNLLQTDLSKRYGILKHGVNDIKDHEWFKKIFWIALINKGLKAPYIPHIKPTKTYNEESLRPMSDDLYKSEFADF